MAKQVVITIGDGSTKKPLRKKRFFRGSAHIVVFTEWYSVDMRVTFYGGTETVTGSNFLVESTRGKILIDCGIEQGGDVTNRDTYEPFPYDPSTVDALVVTHAHLDHIGLIPKLVKDGFRGKIYMTPPTRDLTALILLDAAHIQRQDAEKDGREPLYIDQDVETAMSLVDPLEYHTEKEVAPGLFVYLRNTGHILGSASIRVKSEDGTTCAFTGDIGNSPSPLLPDWEPIPDADALLMESVYGDRLHPPHEERVAKLRDTLRRGIERGGTILIPAFSLERTQLMLYEISNFFSDSSLPKVPVFLDSPLAIHVTAVYEKWGPTYFKKEAEDEMKREGSLFQFPFLKMTPNKEDSANIGKTSDPKIIIAGAGMSHGGRIGGWEARYLGDPKSTLCMVGYQAPGTPGRRIVEGVSTVRIGAAEINVRAAIEKLEGWSAHADRDQLLAFADACLNENARHDVSIKDKRTKAIFVALGEPATERFLAQRIHDYLGVRAIVPEYGQVWDVTKDGVKKE